MADPKESNGTEYQWTEEDVKPTRRWASDIPATAAAPSAGVGTEYLFNEPPSMAKDIRSSAASQAKYIPGDIASIVGGAGELYDIAKAKAAKYLVGYPAEYLGYARPGTAEEIEKEMAPEPGAVTNKVLGVPFPTPAGMEKLTRSFTPESWEYEPQLLAGKLAGSATRVGGGAALTGALGALEETPTIIRQLPTLADSRLIFNPQALKETLGATVKTAGKEAAIGAGSGVASELAGQAAENFGFDEADPYARFLGGVLGVAGGHTVARSVRYLMPDAEAQAQLVSAMGQDFATGQSKISPEHLQKMINEGYKPTAWDVVGPRGEALLEKMGFKTPESKAAIKKLNQDMIDRGNAASGNVASYLEEKVKGAPLDAPALQKKIDAQNQITTGKIYDLAKNSPNAESVFSPKLRELMQVDDFKKAMKVADSVATDPASGIIAGTDRPPNLMYWDQVKRSLDDQIGTALKGGAKDEARRLMGLKGRLTSELDSIVPEYADARGAAAEAFGSSNAIESGYNSIKNMNAFKASDYLDLRKKLSSEQQELMAQGAASAVKDEIQNRGLDAFLKAADKPAMQTRLRMVLGKDPITGEERFDSIVGKARVENMLAKTGQVAAQDPKSGLGLWAGIGGTLGTLAEGAGATVLQGQLPSASQTAGIVGAAITSAAAKGAFNFAQNRVANSVVKLMTSTDPDKLEKLAKMAQKDYAVASMLDKVGDMSQKALLLNSRVNPPYESEREGRKSGGRVGVMTAEALLRDLKRRRVMLASKTEHMLSLPDDAVVQALDAAKR